MIPYDDLVAALAAWRARQGLPVAQSAAAAAAPPPAPARGRAAPPPAARPTPAAVPAQARAVPAESHDFDAGALVEEDAGYDSGEDYVMQLGAEHGEATAIGAAPEPAPGGSPRGKRPGW
jgi:hypothetical protein